MKVLVISSDKNIFKENSGVRQRIIEYGNLVDEMHIIVFSRQSSAISQKFGNVFLYPTNSWSKWFYVCDAIKIGKKIIENCKLKIENCLITAQDPFECGIVGYAIAKKFNLPLQLQIHTDFLSPYFVEHLMFNKLRVWIAKFLIPRANCIRVVSERIKKSLASNFKIQDSRILVLPIFVDVEKIKNTPIKINLHNKYPQFDFIILMAGRLAKEKNIKLAIGAMAEIVKRFPKTGLIIVGFGSEEKNLKLSNSVIIEPWTDDLISYYKTADLFLLTSNYEGYGMTLVEAAAAGCKIISSDVGIAGEIIKKENIFNIGDKKDLEYKIEKAIKGEIEQPLSLNVSSKNEYLENYKKSWETCAF